MPDPRLAMIYLDNAATSSPKPPSVAEAMVAHLGRAANPGRAGHRLAIAAERMIDDCRLGIARLLNVDDPRRIILTLNGTDGLNMAIHGVLACCRPCDNHRPHVVTTVLEHNSISRPLVALRDAGTIDLTQVGCDAEGFLSPAEMARAVGPSTVLVAFLHASNALGTIQPAAEIIRAVRAASEAFILIDAAQAVGVVPIDVGALGADLIAFPGHKGLLGPTGTGALYVGPRVFPDRPEASPPRIAPLRHGGTGGDSTSPTMPRQLPYYLEGGTPNTVGIAGLAAGVAWVAERGVERIAAHERRLIGQAMEGLGAIRGVRIVGPRDVSHRIGALSFVIEGMDPGQVGAVLDDSFLIAVRPGLHCAPHAHRAMGTFPAGTVRISPGPFSTEAEIAALIEAIAEVAAS